MDEKEAKLVSDYNSLVFRMQEATNEVSSWNELQASLRGMDELSEEYDEILKRMEKYTKERK